MRSTASPIPVYHVRGAYACGLPAISARVKHPFGDGRTFPADNVITLAGETPIRGTVPVCGSCGYVIDSFAELSYEQKPADTRSLLTRLWTKLVRH